MIRCSQCQGILRIDMTFPDQAAIAAKLIGWRLSDQLWFCPPCWNAHRLDPGNSTDGVRKLPR